MYDIQDIKCNPSHEQDPSVTPALHSSYGRLSILWERTDMRSHIVHWELYTAYPAKVSAFFRHL